MTKLLLFIVSGFGTGFGTNTFGTGSTFGTGTSTFGSTAPTFGSNTLGSNTFGNTSFGTGSTFGTTFGNKPGTTGFTGFGTGLGTSAFGQQPQVNVVNNFTYFHPQTLSCIVFSFFVTHCWIVQL